MTKGVIQSFTTMLLTTLLIAAPAPASTASLCSGKLTSLLKYAGSETESFLKDPAVASRMALLVGPQLRRLKQNLQVHGYSVNLIDCALVVEGNAPHQGTEQNAILNLNVVSGEMTVGILSLGKINIYTMTKGADAPDHYYWLPTSVKEWAYVAADRFRSRQNPPSHVSVRSPQGK